MYVILLGLPGAGKGTQATRLKEQTGLAHISTGDLFRESIAAGTELGEKAKPYLEQGLLVPDEITIGMLLDRIEKPDCKRGCVLDGFPRTTEQARSLDKALEREEKRIDRVIYVKVATEELVRRLAGRWLCKNCGSVYHETNQPPARPGVCDNCGGELYQRVDDRADVVRTRLQVNLNNLEALLDHYGRQDKLVEVNGERDVDDITGDIKKLIGSSYAHHS